jgi:hypothetical protein
MERVEWRSSPFPLICEQVVWLMKVEGRLKRIDGASWRRLNQGCNRQMIERKFEGVMLLWSVL